MPEAAKFRVRGASTWTRRDHALPPRQHDPKSLRVSDLVAERDALRELMKLAKARERFF